MELPYLNVCIYVKDDKSNDKVIILYFLFYEIIIHLNPWRYD